LNTYCKLFICWYHFHTSLLLLLCFYYWMRDKCTLNIKYHLPVLSINQWYYHIFYILHYSIIILFYYSYSLTNFQHLFVHVFLFVGICTYPDYYLLFYLHLQQYHKLIINWIHVYCVSNVYSATISSLFLYHGMKKVHSLFCKTVVLCKELILYCMHIFLHKTSLSMKLNSSVFSLTTRTDKTSVKIFDCFLCKSFLCYFIF